MNLYALALTHLSDLLLDSFNQLDPWLLRPDPLKSLHSLLHIHSVYQDQHKLKHDPNEDESTGHMTEHATRIPLNGKQLDEHQSLTQFIYCGSSQINNQQVEDKLFQVINRFHHSD